MNARIWFLTGLAISLMDAQTLTTGEITGLVTDSSGAVVVRAAVVLRDVDTGERRTVQSSSTGIYRLAFVKPGTYEVSGSSAGLSSDTGRLIVAVGQVQVVNLVLKIEQPKEVVLVTDSTPLLQTDNANTTYTLSTRQLD